MKNTDWLLKVPQFSIHGESASPKDVERLASELMAARKLLNETVTRLEMMKDQLKELLK